MKKDNKVKILLSHDPLGMLDFNPGLIKKIPNLPSKDKTIPEGDTMFLHSIGLPEGYTFKEVVVDSISRSILQLSITDKITPSVRRMKTAIPVVARS